MNKQEKMNLACHVNTPIELLYDLAFNPNQNIEVIQAIIYRPFIPIELITRLIDHESSIIRKAIAEHPMTTNDMLHQLSLDKDLKVLIGVAMNHNTPVDILLKLSKRRSKRLQIVICNNPNASLNILEYFSTKSKDNDSKCAIINNPNVSQELLLKYAKDDDEWVRFCVETCQWASMDVIEELVLNESNRISISAREDVPSEILQKIIDCELESTKNKLLNSSDKSLKEVNKIRKLSFVQLVSLSHRRIQKIIYNIVRNPKTSSQLLKDLSLLAESSEYNAILDTIAKHPNAPRSLASKLPNATQVIKQKTVEKHLCTETDESILFSFASDPKTPVEILEQLVDSKSELILCSLARNPSTPINILERLHTDQNTRVRLCVAYNVYTPIKILKILLNDNVLIVQNAAFENLYYRQELNFIQEPSSLEYT